MGLSPMALAFNCNSFWESAMAKTLFRVPAPPTGEKR
jgi:hypothetical protein